MREERVDKGFGVSVEEVVELVDAEGVQLVEGEVVFEEGEDVVGEDCRFSIAAGQCNRSGEEEEGGVNW